MLHFFLISSLFVHALVSTANSYDLGGATIYTGCRGGGKTIALTYDDGPSVENTPKLLDVLAKNRVKATFFVLGAQLANGAGEERKILARAFRDGHVIGSHTFSHSDLTTLDKNAIKQEMISTDALIKQSTGQSSVTFMRPPFG